MGSLKEHDRLVDLLARRLVQKGYEVVLKNIEYHVAGAEGELDILASRDGVRWTYFECKSGRSYNKAKKQYERAKAHWHEFWNSDLPLRGVYVDYKQVRRL